MTSPDDRPKRTTKIPTEVAVAVRIVGSARTALTAAMTAHAREPWDREVLTCEVTRLLGMLLRSHGATPDQLDEVVRFLREVYAGVYAGSAMSIEQAVNHYCGANFPPDHGADAPGVDSPAGSECTDRTVLPLRPSRFRGRGF